MKIEKPGVGRPPLGPAKTTGQICPLLSTRMRNFSPGLKYNNTSKYWSGNFPTTLSHLVKLGKFYTDKGVRIK
jgi:hypothetical protein